MSETTKIEWCDSTFNPWIGCTRVSPACDDCYAARSTPARTLGVTWGAGEPRRRTSFGNWKQPEAWQRQAAEFRAKHGRRRRVFCASLADVFDNEVPDQWRADLFALIAATPDMDWLLVTKRIGNVARMLGDWQTVPLLPNIWLGITVVNQEEADRDVPKLLRVPAAVRFLSVEPMLGPINLLAGGDILCRCDGCLSMARKHPESAGLQRIDWVICGGESGPKARPMRPDWARGLRDQCAAAGVPFLFKQWGEWLPVEVPSDEECFAEDGSERALEGCIRVQRGPGHQDMARIGKKAAGRLLDGRTHDGFPGGA